MDYENNANPDEIVKDEIKNWRKAAVESVELTDRILHEAHILKGMGLGNKDYLHVACACSIKADYFVTVDKGIIRKLIMW